MCSQVFCLVELVCYVVALFCTYVKVNFCGGERKRSRRVAETHQTEIDRGGRSQALSQDVTSMRSSSRSHYCDTDQQGHASDSVAGPGANLESGDADERRDD